MMRQATWVGDKPIRVFTVFVVLAALAAGLGTSWRISQVQAADFEKGDTVVVNTDYLNLRDGPSLDAYHLAILMWGDVMEVTGGPEMADGYTWYPVVASVKGPMPGWVAGEFLRLQTTPPDDGATNGFTPQSDVRVDTDLLNVRTGPGLDFPVVGQVTRGKVFTVDRGPYLADGYSWYVVVEPSELWSGWVAGEFLALESDEGTSGFAVGDAIRVASGAQNLREAPGTDAEVFRVMANGELLQVRGGPVEANGYTWYRVWNYSGEGWAAGEFLRLDPNGWPEEGGA